MTLAPSEAGDTRHPESHSDSPFPSEPRVHDDRPVEFWPTSSIRSALETGDITVWQRIVVAIKPFAPLAVVVADRAGHYQEGQRHRTRDAVDSPCQMRVPRKRIHRMLILNEYRIDVLRVDVEQKVDERIKARVAPLVGETRWLVRD